MALPAVNLSVTADLLDRDPEEIGAWLRRLVDTYHATDPDTPTDDTDADADNLDNDPADEIIDRWKRYQPLQRDNIEGLVAFLKHHFALLPSESRTGGGARTYLRVIRRRDNVNLGFLSSSSFVLSHARTSPLANDPLVKTVNGNGTPLRYPRIDLKTPEAYHLLHQIAEDMA